MEKNFIFKEKKITVWPYIFLGLCLGSLTGVIIFFYNNASAQNSITSEQITKYTASIDRVDNLIETFPKEIFSNVFLVNARQPIVLPINIGNIGKTNPFLINTPPDKLLTPIKINR
jgi:hypothetical protein